MGKQNFTQLQLIIADLLLSGELTGRELRDQLAKLGHQKSFPAFYQIMARLKQGGFVAARERKGDGRYTLPDKAYRLTAEGRALYKQTCAARPVHASPATG